jgi:hypothetical protein
MWSNHLQNHSKYFFRHFPTQNQVFKVQNVAYFSVNVPFTCHFSENPRFQNVFFFKTIQNALQICVHILKCFKCKMFHNFLGMFFLPSIFRKIQGFKMWSISFQSLLKCFVDTSLHIRPFQVFSRFSVHPKIKNLSFSPVKTHRWVGKPQQFSIINGIFHIKTFDHNHSSLSCTVSINCNLDLSAIFCIHITYSLMNIFYIVFS